MKYLCSICDVANDPAYYAMEKIGGRWYHTFCLRKAAIHAVNEGFKFDWEKINVP